MSFWAKSNAKTICKYIKKHKDKPGILAIINNRNENIIVFYDEDKIEEDLYFEYDDIEVDCFSVKHVLANASFMLKKYSECEQEQKIVNYLENSVKLCKNLLSGKNA